MPVNNICRIYLLFCISSTNGCYLYILVQKKTKILRYLEPGVVGALVGNGYI